MIRPNDSGKTLVTDCQVLSINDLLRQFQAQYKEAFLESVTKIIGVEICFDTTPTPFGGKRIWFMCPICDRRVEKLYKDPNNRIGCRVCLKLDYASRRYKGMIEDQFYNTW